MVWVLRVVCVSLTTGLATSEPTWDPPEFPVWWLCTGRSLSRFRQKLGKISFPPGTIIFAQTAPTIPVTASEAPILISNLDWAGVSPPWGQIPPRFSVPSSTAQCQGMWTWPGAWHWSVFRFCRPRAELVFNTSVQPGGKINCLHFNSRVIAVAGTGQEGAGAVTLLSFRTGCLLQHLQTEHSGQINNILLTRCKWVWVYFNDGKPSIQMKLSIRGRCAKVFLQSLSIGKLKQQTIPFVLSTLYCSVSADWSLHPTTELRRSRHLALTHSPGHSGQPPHRLDLSDSQVQLIGWV